MCHGGLGPALDGVGTVFLASSDHPRQDQLEIAMIDACRSRGIKRVVKLSAQSAGHDPPVSFGVLHARAEQRHRVTWRLWVASRPTAAQGSNGSPHIVNAASQKPAGCWKPQMDWPMTTMSAPSVAWGGKPAGSWNAWKSR